MKYYCSVNWTIFLVRWFHNSTLERHDLFFLPSILTPLWGVRVPQCCFCISRFLYAIRGFNYSEISSFFNNEEDPAHESQFKKLWVSEKAIWTNKRIPKNCKNYWFGVRFGCTGHPVTFYVKITNCREVAVRPNLYTTFQVFMLLSVQRWYMSTGY